MARTLTPNGWEMEDGEVVLHPLTGFKVVTAGEKACVLQLAFYRDEADIEADASEIVQLVVPMEAAEKLKGALETAVAELKAPHGRTVQ